MQNFSIMSHSFLVLQQFLHGLFLPFLSTQKRTSICTSCKKVLFLNLSISAARFLVSEWTRPKSHWSVYIRSAQKRSSNTNGFGEALCTHRSNVTLKKRFSRGLFTWDCWLPDEKKTGREPWFCLSHLYMLLQVDGWQTIVMSSEPAWSTDVAAKHLVHMSDRMNVRPHSLHQKSVIFVCCCGSTKSNWKLEEKPNPGNTTPVVNRGLQLVQIISHKSLRSSWN